MYKPWGLFIPLDRNALRSVHGDKEEAGNETEMAHEHAHRHRIGEVRIEDDSEREREERKHARCCTSMEAHDDRERADHFEDKGQDNEQAGHRNACSGCCRDFLCETERARDLEGCAEQELTTDKDTSDDRCPLLPRTGMRNACHGMGYFEYPEILAFIFYD